MASDDSTLGLARKKRYGLARRKAATDYTDYTEKALWISTEIKAATDYTEIKAATDYTDWHGFIKKKKKKKK